ncbi:helix-turn-helix domain-containing protein [Gordonia sp. NPDC003376]
MRKEQTSQWALDTYQRFGEALRQQRDNKGMTAQQLSDRTTELGYPISRSAIANAESGRKKALDITEVIILAKALDVSPLELIYPGLIDAEVEVTPGVYGRSSDAALGFAGYLDDEAPMRTVYALHNARLDFDAYGNDPDDASRDNARQTVKMATRLAKAEGWIVNDG